MLRYAAVAAILAVVACSDNATAPSRAPAITNYPLAVKYDTARGTIAAVAVDDHDLLGVFLVTEAGDSLRLTGPVADVLAGMPGVEFWVEGNLGIDRTMEVVNYAFRGPDLGKSCEDPEHRIIGEDGKCHIAETSKKPRKE